MAEVACFCGCLFSFDGAAGACPGCGEAASVTAGPAPRSIAIGTAARRHRSARERGRQP